MAKRKLLVMECPLSKLVCMCRDEDGHDPLKAFTEQVGRKLGHTGLEADGAEATHGFDVSLLRE